MSGGASSDVEDTEEQVEMLEALVLSFPSVDGVPGVWNAFEDQEEGDRSLSSRVGDSANGVGLRRCGAGVNGDWRISGRPRSGACAAKDRGGGSIQDDFFLLSRRTAGSNGGVVTKRLGESTVPNDSSLDVGLCP